MQAKQNGRREYRHGDTLYPGVTDITSIINKPGLNKWRMNAGAERSNDVMESAKEFGTRVHEATEAAILAGCTPSDCRCDLKDREMWPYHQAVADFLDLYVEKIHAVEMPVVSSRLQLGGTVDLYVKLQSGSHAVIDFKTSKWLYPEYALQTAAYCILLYLNEYPIEKRWAVHLKKDAPGEYEIKQYEDDWEDIRAFLAALEVWYWKYGTSQKQHGFIV